MQHPLCFLYSSPHIGHTYRRKQDQVFNCLFMQLRSARAPEDESEHYSLRQTRAHVTQGPHTHIYAYRIHSYTQYTRRMCNVKVGGQEEWKKRLQRPEERWEGVHNIFRQRFFPHFYLCGLLYHTEMDGWMWSPFITNDPNQCKALLEHS